MLVAVSAITACGGRFTNEDNTGDLSTGLRRAQTCDDLVGMLRADAVVKLDQTIANLSEGGLLGGERGGVDDVAAEPGASNGTDGAQDDSSGDGGEKSGNEYSDTNTQVRGVDEADIVKTDGTNIWVLQNGELRTIVAYPPQSLAATHAVTIEGTPIEMYVADGYAVVFSQVHVDVELPGFDGGGGYDTAGPGTSEPMPPGGGDYPDGYYGSNAIKITTIGLGERDAGGYFAEAPQVLKEFYAVGGYVSSRRHGNVVRVVVNEWVQAPNFYPPGELYGESAGSLKVRSWRSEMLKTVNAIPVNEWLAPRFEKISGAMNEVSTDCALFYAPEEGSTDYGLTSVITVPLNGEGPVTGPSVLGASHIIYANADSLIVAHSEWSRGFWDAGHDSTVLHEFRLSDTPNTVYVGSGSFPGSLNDQFSIDAKDGVVRVSATVNNWGERGGTDNHVYTLRQNDGGLRIVGDTGPMAEGEHIESTRYVGDIAYVVTFRQTDPLFAIDLANPENPTVLGELKIPGFSTYMHPLGDNHLLTIGRHRGDDGVSQDALALKIFDVSDPASPTTTSEFVMPTDGYSAAESQHKAFNYYAEKGLLAIPFEGWRSPKYTSTLEVFRATPTAGLKQLGSIDHSPYFEGYNPSGDAYYGNGPLMRRGVFIEEYLYSISAGAILIHDVFDLEEPVGELRLR